jgi:hypothetical protein
VSHDFSRYPANDPEARFVIDEMLSLAEELKETRRPLSVKGMSPEQAKLARETFQKKDLPR